MKRETKEFLLSFLYPARCCGCGKIIDSVSPEPLCKDCGEHLKPDIVRRSINGVRSISYCKYGGVAREIVLTLKFRRLAVAGELIGHRLAVLCNTVADIKSFAPEVCVAAPITKRRLAERCYNQSELIALTLCRETGIELVSGAIKKERNTKPQSSIESAEKRALNVKDVYSLTDVSRISGKRVLLLDDVVTTGSTLGELVRTVRSAADSVYCMTFASSELGGDIADSDADNEKISAFAVLGG